MPDLYDTAYPGEVAGHVIEGSFIGDDGLVQTTRGPDIGFDGSDIERRKPMGDADEENAGYTSTNRAIGEAVKKANERDDQRKPVTDAASSWQTGNTALLDGNAVRLLINSPNRKSVVITNQSAATVYVGRDSGLKAGGPNTCYLPAGAGRVFTHTAEIWVVGVAGQVVDWVEENY
jgi:hypothetical protein